MIKKAFKCHIIYLLSIILFFSCSNRETDTEVGKETNKQKEDLPVPVKYVEINKGIFNRELLANGKLEAIKRANLKFLTDGIINRIYIKESDRVGANQLLSTLSRIQQERSYNQNKLRYQQAILDYEDQLLRLGYRLNDTANIDKGTKNIVRLRSGLSNASIELKRSETDLSYTNLNAPFSGKIANLKAKTYNSSSAFEYFCTLIDDSELFVDFQILEQELAFVRASKTVIIKPFNDESLSYTGSIVSINPLVDKSGMVAVRALVQNKQQKLLDGMSVRIIVRQSIQGQLKIPKNALLERQGRKVVFTVNGNTAYWNYVDILFENSTEYAIKTGLKAGDKVIYEGNFNLAHDKPIKVDN